MSDDVVANRIPYLQRRVEELALEDDKQVKQRPRVEKEEEEEEEESDKQATSTGSGKEPPFVDDDVSPMELQENEDDQGSAEEYSTDGEENEAPEEIDRELIIKKLLENYYSSYTGPSYGYCSACVKNEVCKICRHKNGYPADYNPAELSGFCKSQTFHLGKFL